MKFKKNDYVTRKSYNHDIVFKVVNIENNIVYLKGVDFRLYADALIDDLVICERNDSNDKEIIENNLRELCLDRDNYFYIPGKILHIDSDIKLSNGLAKPYKIRKNAKIQNCKNHQKKHKMTKI